MYIPLDHLYRSTSYAAYLLTGECSAKAYRSTTPQYLIDETHTWSSIYPSVLQRMIGGVAEPETWLGSWQGTVLLVPSNKTLS